MEYSFDVEVAVEHGLFGAILIKNFQYWLIKNKANGKNFYDGRHWTFNSVRAYQEIFPFLSPKQIRTAIDGLVKSGILIKGNYNQKGYDRTSWYAFRDESRWLAFAQQGKSISPTGQMISPIEANDFAQEGEPIPDNKPDNKPDIIYISEIVNCWNSCGLQRHSEDVAIKHLKNRHLEEINDVGVASVIKAIENYAKVINDPGIYWFNHRWTLWDFIARGLHNFIDDARPLENYMQKKKGNIIRTPADGRANLERLKKKIDRMK